MMEGKYLEIMCTFSLERRKLWLEFLMDFHMSTPIAVAVTVYKSTRKITALICKIVGQYLRSSRSGPLMTFAVRETVIV